MLSKKKIDVPLVPSDVSVPSVLVVALGLFAELVPVEVLGSMKVLVPVEVEMRVEDLVVPETALGDFPETRPGVGRPKALFQDTEAKRRVRSC